MAHATAEKNREYARRYYREHRAEIIKGQVERQRIRRAKNKALRKGPPKTIDLTYQTETDDPIQIQKLCYRLLRVSILDAKGLIRGVSYTQKWPIKNNAINWIYSDDISWGSFRWVCQVLDWEPEDVRRKFENAPRDRLVGLLYDG
jgi:hypothetical protein